DTWVPSSPKRTRPVDGRQLPSHLACNALERRDPHWPGSVFRLRKDCSLEIACQAHNWLQWPFRSAIAPAAVAAVEIDIEEARCRFHRASCRSTAAHCKQSRLYAV